MQFVSSINDDLFTSKSLCRKYWVLKVIFYLASVVNLSTVSYYCNMNTSKMTFLWKFYKLRCWLRVPVSRDEISTRPAGTDFTLRLHASIKFHPGRAGQFSTWYLFRFVQIFFCKHVLNYFFIPLRWTEVITWGNFVPEKRDLVNRI